MRDAASILAKSTSGKRLPRPRALAEALEEVAARPAKDWADPLREDQVARWQHGERIRVETYLEKMPALANQADALLDLLYGEVLLREEAGEAPLLSEYQLRFPRLQEELARQFEVHQALRAAGPTIAPAPTQAGVAAVIPAAAAGAPPLAATGRKKDWPDVPGYEIVGELGRGGSGVVYKARQVGLNRLVALKMILSAAYRGSHYLVRFRREALSIARLHHPHIVQVYDVGEHAGRPFFSLEYVPGGSLADYLKGEPLPVEGAAALVQTLAQAIGAAHKAGLIHRDLKPANVLLVGGPGSKPSDADTTSPLYPKITDFGLAKEIGGGPARGEETGHETQPGEILGTPMYMAPEQAQGKGDQIGPAADIHALGAILYELLTGRPPYRADNMLDTLLQVAYQQPEPPSKLNPRVPADLQAICLKCLAKEPGKRYATAAALAEDLDRFRSGQPVAARPVGPVQRLRMWAKRKPALALALTAVVAVTAIGSCWVLAEWGRAEQALGRFRQAYAEANQARKEAEEAKTKAEIAQTEKAIALDEAETILARSQITLARSEMLNRRYAEAEEQLDICPPDRRLWEWQYLKNQCQLRVRTLDGGPSQVVGVAASPNGRYLATVGREVSSLRLWNAASGELLYKLEGHSAAAFSSDSKWLAAGGRAFGVHLWELVADGSPHDIFLTGAKARVTSVAVSSDGKYVAGAAVDHTFWIWNVKNGRTNPVSVQGHVKDKDDAIQHDVAACVALSPDGKTLATVCMRSVRLWDVATAQPLPLPGSKASQPHLVHISSVVHGLAFRSGGEQLAVACADNMAYLYDVKTGKEIHKFEGHTGVVRNVAFSNDGKQLATVSRDGSVRLWSATAPYAEQLQFPGFFQVAFFGPEGQYLLGALRNGSTAVWVTKAPAVPPALEHSSFAVMGAAFTPNGKTLITGGVDRTVRFWDPVTRKEQDKLQLKMPNPVISLALTPNGRWLLLSCAAKPDEDSGDISLRIRNLETGKEQSLSGHTSTVLAIAASRDNRYFATGSADQTVKLWEAETGKLVRSFTDATRRVTSVAFNADGRMLACACEDGVWAWNTETGETLLPGLKKNVILDDGADAPRLVKAVEFSPDGRWLAVGTSIGAIRMWDVKGDRPGPLLLGHTAEVQSLAFTPDGRRLASAGHDAAVRIWDPLAGVELLALTGHKKPVTKVVFSPDGRVLVSTSRDKTANIWDGRAVGP